MSKGFTPIRYDGSEEIFETIIKDGTGRIIGKWKCMKKDYPKVAKILRKQYGIKMFIKDYTDDTDLDWAR